MARRIGEVHIRADWCQGCYLCVVSCPTGSLRPGAVPNRYGVLPPEFLPGTGCTGCEVCSRACPEEGIEVEHRRARTTPPDREEPPREPADGPG